LGEAGRAERATEMQLAGADGEMPAPLHDCWSTIGVSGNGTCRELHIFVHCRNCPVYSAAGVQLLDRPLPADYRRERTNHFARAKTLTQPALTSVLIFRLGPDWLALPSTAFQEVAERRPIHTLPHRRGGVVLGLANVRGELLVCVSLAGLLGKESSSTLASGLSPRGRLLVVKRASHRLVFPVDEVFGIHRCHVGDIKEPPATIANSALTYTRGVFARPPGMVTRAAEDERAVGLLDADLLFNALNLALAAAGPRRPAPRGELSKQYDAEPGTRGADDSVSRVPHSGLPP